MAGDLGKMTLSVPRALIEYLHEEGLNASALLRDAVVEHQRLAGLRQLVQEWRDEGFVDEGEVAAWRAGLDDLYPDDESSSTPPSSSSTRRRATSKVQDAKQRASSRRSRTRA
jgi:hypothetical protein